MRRQILSASQQSLATSARVSAKEFTLVLPATRLGECIHIAARLCARLEHNNLDTDRGELQTTASFGVATISARDTCLRDVIVGADTAL